MTCISQVVKNASAMAGYKKIHPDNDEASGKTVCL